jgi:hypothetical protein
MKALSFSPLARAAAGVAAFSSCTLIIASLHPERLSPIARRRGYGWKHEFRDAA